MTSADTIVTKARLGILLYLDKDVTGDGLFQFPLAGCSAEY